MRELQDLVREWQALEPEEVAVLATVVATSGSTYRKPGARMLIRASGRSVGAISGGCLESDLISRAYRQTEQGPRLVEYDSSASEDIVWGFGLGCNGAVKVLLERVSRESPVLAAIQSCIIERRPAQLSADLIPPSATRVGGSSAVGAFAQTLRPPVSLTVFGAGHDVVPVARLAMEMGWTLTVADDRKTSPDTFPGATIMTIKEAVAALETDSAVVVMTHNYLRDIDVLRELATRQVGYLGILGPRKRTNRLLNDLRKEGAAGLGPLEAVLHAPVGLPIGGEGPQAIALSIVAEIHAALNPDRDLVRKLSKADACATLL